VLLQVLELWLQLHLHHRPAFPCKPLLLLLTVRPLKKILSPEQLEAAARKSVSEFIKEKYKPRGDKDERLISTLKASAKCFAEQNWLLQKQLSPNNAQRLSDAERLWRQAHETRQGLAETREDIVGEKIAELIRVDLVLEHRLKNHPTSRSLRKRSKHFLISQRRLTMPFGKI
jgi:hypothetical protein